MVVFLLIAALGALAAGASTWIVVKLQKQEAIDSATALAKYKIDAKKDSDLAIAQVRSDAEIKINAVREEASTENKKLEKATADANERAAEIMKATAWRQFQPDQIEKLEDSLSKNPSKILLAWIANDAESLSLAVQFSKILEKARWQVEVSAKTFSTQLIWGIVIPPSPGASDATQLLRNAFVGANVPFSKDELPQENMSYGISSAPPDFATILFGSKKPVLAQPPN